ncbi:MAG: DUF1761 domain-containing protein [Candidatus Zambryskibacteria bacterium]|nr:DUF1761 domain-containing protein [Candidatus Zambryskibacteria bacterium]
MNITEVLVSLTRPALIGGIALFVFGYLWYSVVFKNFFMKLREGEGKNGMGTTGKEMAKTLGVKFVLDVLTAASFTLVAYPTAPYRLTLLISSIIWIGFTLPQIMSAYLWDNRSLKYTAFEIVFSLASFAVLMYVIRMVLTYLV